MKRSVVFWLYLLSLVLALSSLAHAAGKIDGYVCTTDFVAEKVGDPNWVILDGRGMGDYLKGHIPGAVNFGKPAVVVLKHPVDGRIVSVEEAERLLGGIGLSNDKGLIVYGTKGDYHVACEQMPLFLGVKQFCFLDGGYEAWAEEGRKIDVGRVIPKPTMFKAKLERPDLYVSTDEMIKIVKEKRPNITLLDVRSVKEFTAEENTVLRGGRIPGAINIPVDKNLDPKTGKLLPNEKLAAVYKDIPKDHTVILYCHRGCRTAYAFYALTRLGYKDIAIYEDSYIVWSARPDTPVEHEHYLNLRGVMKNVESLMDRVEALEKKLAGK